MWVGGWFLCGVCVYGLRFVRVVCGVGGVSGRRRGTVPMDDWLCGTQVESLAGAAHASSDDAGVLRYAGCVQKSPVY